MTIAELPLADEELVVLEDIARCTVAYDVGGVDRLRELIQQRQDRCLDWIFERISEGHLVIKTDRHERVIEGATKIERLNGPTWEIIEIAGTRYYRMMVLLAVR